MGQPVPLRPDHDALALAVIYDGASRSQAARLGGVALGSAPRKRGEAQA